MFFLKNLQTFYKKCLRESQIFSSLSCLLWASNIFPHHINELCNMLEQLANEKINEAIIFITMWEYKVTSWG